VTVSESGKKHTVTFNDDDAPATAPLRELVRQVMPVK
jgi:hypothetical protein